MLVRHLLNTSIWAKAFAASVVLIFCLIGLGATAYLTLDGSARGLTKLRNTNLPMQNAVSELTHDAIATHVKLFRHVTWGSNGVSPVLLNALSADISANLTTFNNSLKSFGAAEGLSSAGRRHWLALLRKWEKYDRAARDTLDVAATDAPMATMMLGGTDDDFQKVAAELQSLSELVTDRTRSVMGSLADNAESKKRLLTAGGLAGIIVSALVTLFVAASIVSPIRLVTQAMSRISVGDTDIELSNSNRTDEIGEMIKAIVLFRDNLLLQQTRLLRKNEQLDAALKNMSHGIAMFDADQRLVVCNERYSKIYGLAMDQVKPGMTLQQIIGSKSESGQATQSPSEFLKTMLESSNDGHAVHHLVQMLDGRSVAVAAQSMPGGGIVTTLEDVTERRHAEAQIEYMAHHDALTELPNRVLLRDRLKLALARVAEGSTAVFCLDLDRFKEVNDTLGHSAGDELLKSVAKRLQSCVRECDTVARLGGDEFSIIGVRSEDASKVATRIIAELSQPYDLNGHRIVVGISVGIAVTPDDGVDSDQLLKSADLALYRAKAEGGNIFRFFEPAMGSILMARHDLTRDLRGALTNGEFELYYQPSRNLERDEISGFEALLRWNHPQRGKVLPTEFIPLAEETGLIVPMGEWVLRQACAEALSWPERLKVAVNLSAVQFKTGNLVQTVFNALAFSGLPPQRLELEVTESVLLQGEGAIATLQQLRSLGVSIALDDFGTGYSSLSYLRSFPFDKIKLDRCFVSDLSVSNAGSLAIVRAISQLGTTLGLATTAEGVETPEQLSILKAEGYTEVQGYLFSQPRSAQETACLFPANSKETRAA